MKWINGPKTRHCFLSNFYNHYHLLSFSMIYSTRQRKLYWILCKSQNKLTYYSKAATHHLYHNQFQMTVQRPLVLRNAFHAHTSCILILHLFLLSVACNHLSYINTYVDSVSLFLRACSADINTILQQKQYTSKTLSINF